MRLITFLESVETDRANAAYARRVADGIQEYLNLHEDSKVWGMKPVERKGGIVTMIMGVVPDMLRKLDWSDDDLEPLENLHLLFIDEGSSELGGGYGKWQGKPIIILEMLHSEKPMAYVNTRFSGKKKHFMHELTHHLDSVRTQDKSTGIAGRFKPEELQHNMAAYTSNPKEFNAFFIEVLEELDSVFFRVIPKIEKTNPESATALAKHVLGNSFEEFVNKITKQMFGPEFVMDEKYRRKFVRRLAKHYTDIVSTLRNKGLLGEGVFTESEQNTTGWTNIVTGKSYEGDDAHYAILRQHGAEMGLTSDYEKALDSYHGPSQMAAYNTGHMRWLFWDGHDTLFASGPIEIMTDPRARALVFKYIKRFDPTYVTLEIISANQGKVGRLGGNFFVNNRTGMNQWFQKPFKHDDSPAAQQARAVGESATGGPDSTGWTNAKTGQTFAMPAKIGVNHTPHFHHLRDRSEEMGIPQDLAQTAVDEFAGDAQLKAFDNGWMAWIYDADLYNLGAWLSVRTTLNGWIQNGAAVMRLIKKFAPDTISLDVIDPSSPAGINRQLSFDADKTNPIEVQRWLRSLSSVTEDFKDETTIPNIDEIFADPEYFRSAKKRQARRVQMSPDEYIERALKGFAKLMPDQSPEEVRKSVLGFRDQELVKKYANAMQAGDKFPALSLDYTRGFNQEGLHRAMAAKKLGLETVPVVIVEPV